MPIHREKILVMMTQYKPHMRLVKIPYQASPIVSMLAVIILADGCTIVGTMARATTTILDLRPSTTSALDLFHKNTISAKGDRCLNRDISTYHTCPVTTTEVPISIGRFTRTVRTSLVTAKAVAADVSSLYLWDG